ncbi:MAG: hypothetical protein WCS84_09860 [Nocardioides sp.]
MCRAVRCRTCSKTTWAGCGQHIRQALAHVSQADRCPGHPKVEGEGGGWRKLFGR